MTNFIGPHNTLYVSDLSSTLPAEGEVVGVKAWDVDGHAIPESGAVTPLKLHNHGMTVVDDTELVARFSAGVPMTYEFMGCIREQRQPPPMIRICRLQISNLA